jgi:hypothetical protein
VDILSIQTATKFGDTGLSTARTVKSSSIDNLILFVDFTPTYLSFLKHHITISFINIKVSEFRTLKILTHFDLTLKFK